MSNKGIGSISDIRNKLSYNHELISTCYHEAGHTISGLMNHFFIPAVGIEVTKDKRSKKDLGYTHFDSLLDLDLFNSKEIIDKLIFAEISINYAGLAAEKLFYKDFCGTDKLPMVLKSGSYMDRDRVAEIIKEFDLAPPGKKRHLLKKKLFNETQKALEEHWGDVKLISHALFSRRKLYFSDLKEILIKKSSHKNYWKQQFKDIQLLLDIADSGDEAVAHDILFK